MKEKRIPRAEAPYVPSTKRRIKKKLMEGYKQYPVPNFVDKNIKKPFQERIGSTHLNVVDVTKDDSKMKNMRCSLQVVLVSLCVYFEGLLHVYPLTSPLQTDYFWTSQQRFACCVQGLQGLQGKKASVKTFDC
eukprot:1151385-Pelagomonas_calceolata.AAC.2